jgi:hypothetical protein
MGATARSDRNGASCCRKRDCCLWPCLESSPAAPMRELADYWSTAAVGYTANSAPLLGKNGHLNVALVGLQGLAKRH